MPASYSNAPTKISTAPKISAATASLSHKALGFKVNESTIATLGEAAAAMARVITSNFLQTT